MTAKKVSPEVLEFFSDMGKRSGRARKVKISPEQRKAIAQHAAKARWKDHQAKRPTEAVEHGKAAV